MTAPTPKAPGPRTSQKETQTTIKPEKFATMVSQSQSFSLDMDTMEIKLLEKL